LGLLPPVLNPKTPLFLKATLLVVSIIAQKFGSSDQSVPGFEESQDLEFREFVFPAAIGLALISFDFVFGFFQETGTT
jgi:hypothetical protein